MAQVIHGIHEPAPGWVPISEAERVQLNWELYTLIQAFENQHVGSVMPWVAQPNPLYTVQYKANPLGGYNPQTDLRFTLQLVDNYIVFKTALVTPVIKERLHVVQRDRDHYDAMTSARLGTHHWTYKETLVLRRVNTESRVVVTYDSLGVGLDNKILVFRPRHGHTDELGWLLDILLGTRIRRAYKDEIRFPTLRADMLYLDTDDEVVPWTDDEQQ